MPQLGETVTEGTITRWLKQVGDTVALDEPLFEVSTDKVDSEVPSPAAGVLTEIVVPEGETVEVGARLAVLGDGDGAAAPPAAAPPARSAEAPAPAPTAAPGARRRLLRLRPPAPRRHHRHRRRHRAAPRSADAQCGIDAGTLEQGDVARRPAPDRRARPRPGRASPAPAKVAASPGAT